MQYYTYEAERLPCCLCGRAIHHGGAVVQLKDFSFRLVGQCCGKAHFVDWAQEANAFRSAERIASDRIKARKALASREQFQYQCFQLRAVVDIQEAFRHQIQFAFGDTFNAITIELLRSAGRLSYIENIGQTLSDQGGGAGLRTVQRDTPALHGAGIFTFTNRRKKLDGAISKLRQNLDGMQDCLDRSFSLRGCIKKYNDSLDEIVSVIGSYNDSANCLNSENANILNFWFAKKRVGKSVEVIDGGWIVHTDDGKRQIKQVEFLTLKVPPALLEGRA